MIQFLYDSSLGDERISLIDNQQARLQRWLRQVAAQYNFTIGELTYILCSDDKELAVNREFLGTYLFHGKWCSTMLQKWE